MPQLIRRIYEYRKDRYRVIWMLDNAPKELASDIAENPDIIDALPEVKSEYGKLHCNVARAASSIQALGLCNDWDWFATFTLDPAKYPNRLALDNFRQHLTRFIKYLREKYPGYKCAFLLVPELHKRGDGWHMHGLLRDFPPDVLRLFTLEEKLPYHIRSKLSEGIPMYDFPEYRSRFGFCDIEPLRERDAATGYLTKYVIKGLNATGKHIQKGKHLFFVSRGLQRPKLIETRPFEVKEAASIPAADYTGTLADFQFDGLVPCFPQWIKATINDKERILGYSVWYEFPADGIIPSENE